MLYWWKVRHWRERLSSSTHSESQEGAAAPNPGLGALQEMENMVQGMGMVQRSSWELEFLAMPCHDFGNHLTSMAMEVPWGYPDGADARREWRCLCLCQEPSSPSGSGDGNPSRNPRWVCDLPSLCLRKPHCVPAFGLNGKPGEVWVAPGWERDPIMPSRTPG